MKYNNKFLMADVEAINESAKKYRIHPPTYHILHDEAAMESYVDDANSKFGKMWSEWPEMHPGVIQQMLNNGTDFITTITKEFAICTKEFDIDDSYRKYIEGVTITVI